MGRVSSTELLCEVIRRGQLELLAKILEDPKKGMEALDLMIRKNADLDTRRRLLNLKQALERFAEDSALKH